MFKLFLRLVKNRMAARKSEILCESNKIDIYTLNHSTSYIFSSSLPVGVRANRQKSKKVFIIADDNALCGHADMLFIGCNLLKFYLGHYSTSTTFFDTFPNRSTFLVSFHRSTISVKLKICIY